MLVQHPQGVQYQVRFLAGDQHEQAMLVDMEEPLVQGLLQVCILACKVMQYSCQTHDLAPWICFAHSDSFAQANEADAGVFAGCK